MNQPTDTRACTCACIPFHVLVELLPSPAEHIRAAFLKHAAEQQSKQASDAQLAEEHFIGVAAAFAALDAISPPDPDLRQRLVSKVKNHRVRERLDRMLQWPQQDSDAQQFREKLLEAVYLHAPDVSSILQRQPPTTA